MRDSAEPELVTAATAVRNSELGVEAVSCVHAVPPTPSDVQLQWEHFSTPVEGVAMPVRINASGGVLAEPFWAPDFREREELRSRPYVVTETGFVEVLLLKVCGKRGQKSTLITIDGHGQGANSDNYDGTLIS